MILKRILVLLLISLLISCSTTLSVVDYDDMYFRRSYIAPTWRYYGPYWNEIPYSPFYYYQSPNIIIKPYQAPSQHQPNKPGIEGGRKEIQRPAMRRGSRSN
jgi:hypothetical protein